MEFIISVKETDGSNTKHNVICLHLIQGIEDFLHDFGYSEKDIRAVVIIDE
jgi:hypothetical protein